MAENLQEFLLEVDAEVEQMTQEDFRDFTVKIALDALESVVDLSPVGQPYRWKSRPPPGYVGGAFRGAWIVTLDVPTDDETRRIDPEGSPTREAGESIILTAEPYQPIWITNNMPYALRLEQGWSQQAPTGMVAITIKRLQSIYRRVE